MNQARKAKRISVFCHEFLDLSVFAARHPSGCHGHVEENGKVDIPRFANGLSPFDRSKDSA
ncbi:MAG: hypothetical protein LBU43_04550 [Candidatus Accumulibacter sp.]|jgi:hypothetical protein|nr:hypothetical protein [Accumulibacter sp.]